MVSKAEQEDQGENFIAIQRDRRSKTSLDELSDFVVTKWPRRDSYAHGLNTAKLPFNCPLATTVLIMLSQTGAVVIFTFVLFGSLLRL